jgi:hypothetical protein
VRANIGLFCNPNSAMNQAEENNWTHDIPGVDTHVIRGGTTNGKNDASHYLNDLNGANAYAIKTLVVSADPFFFRTREKLIKAANQWLANDATRRICYPLIDYANVGGTAPTPNVSFWYGPNLAKAYEALGSCAALAMGASGSIGFSDEVETKGKFPAP